ncbi:MAG: hypothetical protein V4521_13180 [Pseudomonadota bacterium]
MAYLFALLVGMAAWQIVVGVRTGDISAVGGVYSSAIRSTQPFRFWLYFLLNTIYLIVGLVLFIQELKP